MLADRERLPVTLDPVQGEALDGYLERVADANHIAPAALLHEVRRAGTPRFLVLSPAAPVIARVAALTGQPESTICSATLNSLNGTAFDLTGFDPQLPATYRTMAARGWGPTNGTQLCPHCLADSGVWALGWRTPFSAVCARHGV